MTSSSASRADRTVPVSVVTVIRNDLPRLRRTWDSLQMQEFERFEWIVVDGASTDGTVAWLKAVQDPRLQFRSEPDRGIYDAMNHGLALASGELTTFLNAGDYYLRPEVLRDVVSRYLADGWVWGHGGAAVVDESGRQVRPVTGGYPGRLRYAFGRNVVIHQTEFVRTQVLKDLGGFDLRFPIGADFHMTLKLGRLVPPAVWTSLDVAYEAGGVSDQDHARALVDGHRARVDVFKMNRVAEVADAAWTKGLFGYVQGRRMAKRAAARLLGRGSIDWWARR